MSENTGIRSVQTVIQWGTYLRIHKMRYVGWFVQILWPHNICYKNKIIHKNTIILLQSPKREL